MKKKLNNSTIYVLKGETNKRFNSVCETMHDICDNSNFEIKGISSASDYVGVTLKEKDPKNYNDVRKKELETIKINLGLIYNTDFKIKKEYYMSFDVSNMDKELVEEKVLTILKENIFITHYKVYIFKDTLTIYYIKTANITNQYFTAQGILIKQRIEKALKIIFI